MKNTLELVVVDVMHFVNILVIKEKEKEKMMNNVIARCCWLYSSFQV